MVTPISTAGAAAAVPPVIRMTSPVVASPLPGVVRAGEGYKPHFGALAREQAAQAVDLVRSALDQLTPVVVVNRRPDVTLDFLARGPDAMMDTIHTMRPAGLGPAARQVARSLVERLHGTYGEGDLAGRTVFGSVRFVPRAATDAARDGAAQLLAQGPRVGVREYGQLALVLDTASIADRTTFSARDTAKAIVSAAPIEDLPQVIVERLARNFGFKRDLLTGRAAYGVEPQSKEPDADPVPAADRQLKFTELLAKPRDEAVSWLRSYLQSDTFAHRDQYLEAQVRGVRPRDVAAIVAEPADHASDEHRFRSFDPGAPIVGDTAAALRDAAASANLVALLPSQGLTAPA